MPFPFPQERPRAAFPASWCPQFVLLEDPSPEKSRMERLRAGPQLCARLCPSLGGLWVVQEGSDLELLLTAEFGDSPVWLSLSSRALLCLESRDCRGVFFCVQCQIWWKCAFLLLLLLLGLCQHHLSWPSTVSLSFASALMWISSSITCDSSKCSVQPLCWLADFCSQPPQLWNCPALFSSAAPLTLEHVPYRAGFNLLLVTYLSGNFKWAWSLYLVRVFLLIFLHHVLFQIIFRQIVLITDADWNGCQTGHFFPYKCNAYTLKWISVSFHLLFM